MLEKSRLLRKSKNIRFFRNTNFDGKVFFYGIVVKKNTLLGENIATMNHAVCVKTLKGLILEPKIPKSLCRISVQGLQFPSTFQKKYTDRWSGASKLPLGVNVCVQGALVSHSGCIPTSHPVLRD